ncbi:MAG: hypothetical protein ACTSXJ_05995 [Candidatus Baldrarchaeia archaeon]
MTKKEIQCPLCGYRFSEEESGCARCPHVKKCRMVMCPNCGYEFPNI